MTKYLVGILVGISAMSTVLGMLPSWTGGPPPPRIEHSLIIKEFAYSNELPPQNISEYTRLFQIGSSVYYLKNVPWYYFLPYLLFLVLFVITATKIISMVRKKVWKQ